MSPPPRFALAPLVVALLAGCADAPQFEARFPPSFDVRPKAVSVIGVYRDGRLDADAWDRLGLGAVVGASTCAPAFGEALRSADPDTFAALDDEARANGISEELIDRLAAARAATAAAAVASGAGVGVSAPH